MIDNENHNHNHNHNHQPQPLDSRRRVSPILVIFLALPLLGLLTAAVLILAEALPQTPAAVSLPTPGPITLPPQPTAASVVGAPADDFTLTTLDGRQVSLTDYRGRVVFLNFWATWCEPCTRELPTFVEFMAAQDPATGPIILAVNFGENPEQVGAYLDEHGLAGLEILMDPDQAVFAEYGVRNMPVTLVIDAEGVLRFPKYGEVTYDELEAYVLAVESS
ncbi:MAG: TlpA family protein disulfide reductase [Chloroflexi bacterium]|nr:TlpA family protein disulfide reductase [Chloroflexota bacterium]